MLEKNRRESYPTAEAWLVCGELAVIVYWELSLDSWKACKDNLCPHWLRQRHSHFVFTSSHIRISSVWERLKVTEMPAFWMSTWKLSRKLTITKSWHQITGQIWNHVHLFFDQIVLHLNSNFANFRLFYLDKVLVELLVFKEHFRIWLLLLNEKSKVSKNECFFVSFGTRIKRFPMIDRSIDHYLTTCNNKF